MIIMPNSGHLTRRRAGLLVSILALSAGLVHILNRNPSGVAGPLSVSQVEASGADPDRALLAAPGTGLSLGRNQLHQGAIQEDANTTLPPDTNCFWIRDTADFSSCIRGAFAGTSSVSEIVDLIGSQVCSQETPRPLLVQSVVLAIEHVSPENFLDLSRKLADRCSDDRGKEIVTQAVGHIAATNKALYFSLRPYLGVDTLFGGDGHKVAVSLAGALARSQDDLDLSSLIREGALGRLGGDSSVIAEAITQTMASSKSGNDMIQFVGDILSSPTRLRSEGVEHAAGGRIVAELLRDKGIPPSSESDTIGALLDLCEDPYWGLGAAAQIIAYRTRSEYPNGIGPLAWGQLWDHAQVIYKTKGDG